MYLLLEGGNNVVTVFLAMKYVLCLDGKFYFVECEASNLTWLTSDLFMIFMLIVQIKFVLGNETHEK